MYTARYTARYTGSQCLVAAPQHIAAQLKIPDVVHLKANDCAIQKFLGSCTSQSVVNFDAEVLTGRQAGRRLFEVLAGISPMLSSGDQDDAVQSWCGAIEASWTYFTLSCSAATETNVGLRIMMP